MLSDGIKNGILLDLISASSTTVVHLPCYVIPRSGPFILPMKRSKRQDKAFTCHRVTRYALRTVTPKAVPNSHRTEWKRRSVEPVDAGEKVHFVGSTAYSNY